MRGKKHKGLLIIIFLISSKLLTAGWVNMNTGITDNLNAVCFWGNKGILAGDKGIYYTTTGGNGAASWKRFTIAGNATDSNVYNNCKFFKIAPSFTNEAYICGWDSINNKAVILFFNVENTTYSFTYIGDSGSKLNDIKYWNSFLYAVGDNGLILKYDFFTSQIPLTILSNTTKNLLSIELSGERIAIGGTNALLFGLDNSSGFNLTAYDYPGSVFNDVSGPGSVFYGVGDTFYQSYDGKTAKRIDAYDFGPLAGKSIVMSPSGEVYVGTGHGIFKTTSAVTFLELQPSSLSHSVNDIEFDATGIYTIYAVGKNGVLLSTTDGGGDTKPYASINLKGACTKEQMVFTGNMGTAKYCTWKVNDSSIATGCYYLTSFPKAGTYKASYIVINDAGLADTAEQIIHIVDPPRINLPVSTSDLTLCKQGQITITIDSTQNDFIYQLMKHKDAGIYGSGVGNGGKLVFKSDLLKEAGAYHINVQSKWSNCQKNFKDSIQVIVEKTKAAFHASLINATVSEGIDFFQKCKDAQHFLWEFTPSSSSSLDTAANPQAIKYMAPGNTSVKLIAWSDHGCYDTITGKGPYIYVEPIQDDSCWAFNLDGNDAAWPGSYTPDVSQQVLTNDGYLIAGTCYDNLFTSRIGASFGRTPYGGGYIAKYSRNGVLKWVTYGVAPNYNFENRGYKPFVASVATNLKTGSIYALGKMRGDEYFHLNTGDSVKVSENGLIPNLNSLNNFIIKLNSSGRMIWNASLKSLDQATNPIKIKEDKAGNLIVIGTFMNQLQYYINGKDTMLFGGIHAAVRNTYMIKLDSNGVVKWSTYFEDKFTNGGCEVRDFDIDEENNIILTGGVEYSIKFHSVNDTSTHIISIPPANFYGAKLYIAKYNANGDFQWSMHNEDATVYAYAIAQDGTGNFYVSGRNDCSHTQCNFVIINSDNSNHKSNVGAYFLLKVNASGKIVWSNGSKLAYYGYGFAIHIKDDEISILGNVKNNGAPWSGIMTSTDGNNLNYSMSAYDLFIARYSSNGVLRSIFNTGPNKFININDEGYFSLLRDNAGDYFLSGNLRNDFVIGSDSVKTNGWDAVMAKMGKRGCNNIIITGVENKNDVIHSDEVNVYPNPITDNLIVSIKNAFTPYDMKIYSVTGACVYSKQVTSSTFSLSKNEFSAGKSGLYFMSLTNDKENLNFSKKIVVVD